MEQLVYDNTISESIFGLPSPKIGLNQTELNHIMRELMSSIDLHTLSSLYFRHLQSTIGISALSINFPSGCISLGKKLPQQKVQSLDMHTQGRNIATLCYRFDDELASHDSQILLQLHKVFSDPLRNALDFDQLKQMAMKDHLTSLGNRAGYEETVHRLVCHARRHEEPFGLLIIDMDKFKQINDAHGHQEGDYVLMAMANVLRTTLRETDYAFRFGGDEFCCLLPGSEQECNQSAAKRIYLAMQSDSVLNKHGISCSIGGANFHSDDTEQSLFQRADIALYEAKESGRQCFKSA